MWRVDGKEMRLWAQKPPGMSHTLSNLPHVCDFSVTPLHSLLAVLPLRHVPLASAFALTFPSAWNAFPPDIHSVCSLNSLKSLLKTHLMGAFPDYPSQISYHPYTNTLSFLLTNFIFSPLCFSPFIYCLSIPTEIEALGSPGHSLLHCHVFYIYKSTWHIVHV